MTWLCGLPCKASLQPNPSDEPPDAIGTRTGGIAARDAKGALDAVGLRAAPADASTCVSTPRSIESEDVRECGLERIYRGAGVMSIEPIPIIVTGKPQLVAHPDLPRRLFNGVRPKYEIAHFCFSAEAFADEFPKVIKGESYAVSSGVGTNVGSSSPRKPKASVVGGGMTDEEFEQMKSVEGADQIKWVRIPTDTMDRLGPALEGLENDIVKWLDELDIQ